MAMTGIQEATLEPGITIAHPVAILQSLDLRKFADVQLLSSNGVSGSPTISLSTPGVLRITRP